MPRLNTSAEVLADVTEIGIMDDVGGGNSGTINGAVAAGATTIVLTAAGTWAAADLFRIGDRPYIEAGEIESIITVTITTKSGLADAYASGEAIVEIADVPIGDLTEDGLTINHEGGDTAIRSGTKAGIWQYIPSGDQSITFEFSVLNLSPENVKEMFGDSTTLLGAGTVADPYVVHVREDLVNSSPEKVWYFIGARVDGGVYRVQANSGRLFAPAGSMQFAQGSPTSLPFVLRVMHGYTVIQY